WCRPSWFDRLTMRGMELTMRVMGLTMRGTKLAMRGMGLTPGALELPTRALEFTMRGSRGAATPLTLSLSKGRAAALGGVATRSLGVLHASVARERIIHNGKLGFPQALDLVAEARGFLEVEVGSRVPHGLFQVLQVRSEEHTSELQSRE